MDIVADLKTHDILEKSNCFKHLKISNGVSSKLLYPVNDMQTTYNSNSKLDIKYITNSYMRLARPVFIGVANPIYIMPILLFLFDSRNFLINFFSLFVFHFLHHSNTQQLCPKFKGNAPYLLPKFAQN